MKNINRRTALLSGAALIAGSSSLVGTIAKAQSDYPSELIRVVVPFSTGGSVDPVARVVAANLSKDFNDEVIVDNRPGGSTVIATNFVANAPADGYTLLMTATSHVTMPQLLTTPFDPIKDFTPVATLSSSQMVLCVHPSVPANNLEELLALAKEKPGELNFSTAGNGNPNHLAAEMMNMMAGVETTHVPYKGGAQAITDLIGGHVQFSFGSPIIVLPQIEAGNLKALAVTGAQRMPQLPDVPTMSEAGLEGYDVTIWYGMLAPAGTPEEVITKLNSDIADIVTRDDVIERFNAAGMVPYTLTPAEFQAVLETDLKKFGEIIKAANISLE